DSYGTVDNTMNFTWNVHVNDTVNSGTLLLPTITSLYQNYPNPFNPITTIRFDIKENESGRLTVFNLKGQIIVSEEFETGQHNYLWNGYDCSSGLYFYQLKTNSGTYTKKMVMMK
ncbi:MAG: T9SS type A sorting domain-containing protein, partial [Candidatus Tenebribacter davisii]|nr:T9SS type A sorting domain-containing protein [Candidatus Tenebribacter davisii]